MPTSPSPAQSMIARVVAQTLAPPPPLSVSEWADLHRTVVMKGSPQPGRWRTSFVPHTRAIMDAFSDPAVRQIDVMKPTQCGGSEAVINMALYAMARMPGNTFWIWANQQNAQDFGRDRLLPEVRACPPAAAHLTGRKHDERVTDIKLDHMNIWLRGAPPNGAGIRGLESWSAPYVFVDETDRCDPETPEVAAKRTSAFPTTKKIVHLGSPGNEGEGIDAQVKASAGGGLCYWIPCAHCGRHFVPHFGLVQWIGGLHRDKAQVRREAWLNCPACGERLFGHQHKAMMQRGVWAPDWNELAPIEDNPLPTPDRIAECLHAEHVGFRIPEFSDPFAVNPYGDVAHDFVENGGMETESWVTHRRGRPWSVRGESPKQHELMRLCQPVAEGGYRLGTIPAGCLAIETAIDMQEREAWVRVRGWGRLGGESWLIWAQRVEHGGGELRELDAVLGWKFPLAPGWCDEHGVVRGGGFMRPIITCIDSGDGEMTQEVYAWVMRHGGLRRNIMPIKGQHGTGVQSGRPYWTTNLSLRGDGRPMPDTAGARPLQLLNVNTNTWKNWVLERCRGGASGIGHDGGIGHQAAGTGESEEAQDAGAGGGVFRAGRIGACVWRFPEAVREQGAQEGCSSEERLVAYFEQVTAEERVTVINKKNGRRERVWRTRVGIGRRNHFFDCEVYGAAAMALRSRNGLELVRAYGLDGEASGTGHRAPGGGKQAPVARADERGEDEGPRFMRKLRG